MLYKIVHQRVEPEHIICYNTPFPEMAGNIISVDYERSSWKYLNYEPDFKAEDLERFKIGGANDQVCDTMDAYRIGKGGGSAYGGEWRPNPDKPNELILRGEPNSIKKFFIQTKGKGYWVHVKYNGLGRAIKIRHYTDHGNPSKHSIPHDKRISYDPHTGAPNFSEYQDTNYWGEAPEFKHLTSEVFLMDHQILQYNPNGWRFKTISEFKSSVTHGAEITFEWNGKEYHICPCWSSGSSPLYSITALDTMQETLCSDIAALMEFSIGQDRLNDIVTQITVCDRTL